MENPEISGRIQMERFIPVEIFRKKVIPFEVPKYLFPVLTETTEIFCTICLDYQCQASCREKVKIFSVFCKWYNPIPFLFSVPKTIQYHLKEIFHRNFRTNGTHSRSPSASLPSMFKMANCHRNPSQRETLHAR